MAHQLYINKYINDLSTFFPIAKPKKTAYFVDIRGKENWGKAGVAYTTQEHARRFIDTTYITPV
jgi:hypothetical protein